VEQMAAGYYKDIDGGNIVGKMKNIAIKNGNKPILITEIGVASVEQGHACMGCWAENKPVDEDDQKKVYQAMLEVLYKEKQNLNLAGIFLFAVDAFQGNEIKDHGKVLALAHDQDPTIFPNRTLKVDANGFTFRGKPAEQVVKQFFLKNTP